LTSREFKPAAQPQAPDLAALLATWERNRASPRFGEGSPGPLFTAGMATAADGMIADLRTALAGAAQPQAEGAPLANVPIDFTCSMCKRAPCICDSLIEAREAGRREGLEEAARSIENCNAPVEGEEFDPEDSIERNYVRRIRALAAAPRPETPPSHYADCNSRIGLECNCGAAPRPSEAPAADPR